MGAGDRDGAPRAEVKGFTRQEKLPFAFFPRMVQQRGAAVISGVQLLLVGAFLYQTTTAAASPSCILTSDTCKTSISKQDHVLKFQVVVNVGDMI